ncbi:hypothetical protein [Tenacibaculum crassostreae]|uniref:hypothetical protein n=1 Tax=Tenacibaculum crassostreae TaxID=502683 RepID=UPI0038956405
MKKSILNLGKALNKAEQKQINGGDDPILGDPGSGGSGSSSTNEYGVCIISGTFKYYKIHCNSLCLDGTQPICSN